MKKIYIVEDHQVMRAGYILLIEMEPDLEVCGEAESAREALEQIPDLAPDLAVVDVSLPGMSGIELVEKLQVSHPELPILVISGHDEDLYAHRTLQAGARGYIDKSAVADVLPDAIRRVLRGELYVSDQVREKYLR